MALAFVLQQNHRDQREAQQRREIAESVTSGRKSGAEMARLYGVSEPTVSRIVAAHRQQFSQQQREQA